MNDEHPDLREIGFEIIEVPGVCCMTPAGSRVFGVTEAFTCADCNQTIGEEEQMFINFGEQPKPLWRHNRACTNG